MKVTVELDLDNPVHRSAFDQLFKVQQDQVMAGPVAEPSPQPAPAPAPPAAEKQPTPPPTPVSNLKDRLNEIFAKIYAKDADLAMAKAQECRDRFGSDNNAWTEDESKQAVSIMEAAARF